VWWLQADNRTLCAHSVPLSLSLTHLVQPDPPTCHLSLLPSPHPATILLLNHDTNALSLASLTPGHRHGDLSVVSLFSLHGRMHWAGDRTCHVVRGCLLGGGDGGLGRWEVQTGNLVGEVQAVPGVPPTSEATPLTFVPPTGPHGLSSLLAVHPTKPLVLLTISLAPEPATSLRDLDLLPHLSYQHRREVGTATMLDPPRAPSDRPPLSLSPGQLGANSSILLLLHALLDSEAGPSVWQEAAVTARAEARRAVALQAADRSSLLPDAPSLLSLAGPALAALADALDELTDGGARQPQQQQQQQSDATKHNGMGGGHPFGERATPLASLLAVQPHPGPGRSSRTSLRYLLSLPLGDLVSLLLTPEHQSLVAHAVVGHGVRGWHRLEEQVTRGGPDSMPAGVSFAAVVRALASVAPPPVDPVAFISSKVST